MPTYTQTTTNALMGGENLAYDPAKQVRIMKEAKAKFEQKLTKEAGSMSIKSAVKVKLAGMGYNFARWATDIKNSKFEKKNPGTFPKASEVIKNMSKGR